MRKTMAEYLGKIWKTLAAGALCSVMVLAVFSLYDLPLEPVIYGAVLCVAAALASFFYGYSKYAAKKKSLERLQKLLPIDLESLPEPEDGNEALYREMLLELNRQRMSAETGRRKMYEEVTDYYTMWVHQIKTPIAAMRLLLQENPDEHQDELAELFKIEQYVEMVLGYLRSEDMASDMKFQQTDLDSVIREQVRKYARIFIGKKIRLDFRETGETVLTDGKWLGFVIGQLLSNSLKYTKNGKISIYMKETVRNFTEEANKDSAEEIDEALRKERIEKSEEIHVEDNTKDSSEQTLVIEDTGIGISPDDLPRVFEKGFTGYNGRGNGRSTGIGLYLCAKIMKGLGHKISMESEPGKGTMVFLELGREELELM